MIQCLHTHTTFCDGRDTTEKMVQVAIQKGLSSIGFSSHSPLPYENDHCILEENIILYLMDIQRLQKKYGEVLSIYTGIEMELLFPIDITPFDYIISSVHQTCINDSVIEIDHTKEILIKGVHQHYHGDFFELIREYYDLEVQASQKGDILGHFDLITKFNEGNCLFDEESDRYLGIALEAMSACLEQDIIIEINTGAMQRGYRTRFYPSSPILTYMKQKNAKIILTSDAHSTDAIGYFYDESVEILKSAGFGSHYILTDNGFQEIAL